MTPALIDANILLRILLQDHVRLTREAQQLIERQVAGSCYVSSVVVAEVVYILFGKKFTRQKLVEAVQNLLALPQFVLDEPAIIATTLQTFTQTKLDFVDCYLFARSRVENLGLHTFDKALDKLAKV